MKHECCFKLPKRLTVGTPGYRCDGVCELGCWVEPQVVEYDKTWFLLWSKRVDIVYSHSLVSFLKLTSSGRERDAALESTLLLAAKNKMLNNLGIHPDWILPVLAGSVAMALHVGPYEKVARGLTKPVEKVSIRKNWLTRSTHRRLEPVIPDQSRLGLSRVRWRPSVRKWVFNRLPEKSRLG